MKTPHRRYKNKLRKQNIRKAKPPWCSWDEVREFIKERPNRLDLDHIIPINHPDVCGLHIPANFQWLPRKHNARKSNKFDGTYENEGWKKK